MRAYFSYWLTDTATREIYAGRDGTRLLDYAGSNQYGKVEVGDEVFIVTTFSNWPFLLGKISVGFCGSQDEAALRLGRQPDELWDAEWHIVAAENTARPVAKIRLSSIVSDLRFLSATGRDRLEVLEGLISGRQLQSMRELRPFSAEELRTLLR